MYSAYFLADGRKVDFPIVGCTTPRDIRKYAELSNWQNWEFHCPALGVVVKP